MSFSVFLNSVNGTGATSSSTYQINWDNINSDGWTGKYKLFFSFVSVGSGLTTTASTIPYIQTNIGATQESYTATTSNGSSNNRVLGYVVPLTIGTNHNLISDYYANPPVIIQRKPTNNQFTVDILNANGTAFTSIDAVEYYLTLYFEKYDGNDTD